MVDARVVAAAVGGGLLALLGASGTTLVAAGWVLGYVELAAVYWLFPLAVVAGLALVTYGVVSLVETLSGGDLFERVDFGTVRRLLD
jgi:hypothetical protein